MGLGKGQGVSRKWFLLFVALLLPVVVVRAEVVPYTLDIKKDDSGAYPVHAMVNDQPLTFLVDSGASRTTIPSSLVDRLGITQCVPETPSSTANGIVNACSVAVELNVGGFRFGVVRVSVLPNMGDHGLLGNDLTSRLKFSQQNGVMTLASDSLDVVLLPAELRRGSVVVGAQNVDVSAGRDKKALQFLSLVVGLLAFLYVIPRFFRKNNKQTKLAGSMHIVRPRPSSKVREVVKKSRLSTSDSSYMYQVDRSLNTVRITKNRLSDVSQPYIDSVSYIGKLKTACFGDVAMAKRLIQYEQSKDFSLSDSDAAKRAWERLADDRR